jgi:hypothetical protein
MGWQSAAAHFHQQLAEVLSGLLYKECELHTDDILPFADSEEEMLQRLHRLFIRFASTISPSILRNALSEWTAWNTSVI